MIRRNKLRITKIAVVLAIPLILWASASGPVPRSTGAPGDNPQACAQNLCHIGTPINSAGGSVSITFSGANNTYMPSARQTITVRVTDPNPANRTFGFQLTARLASNEVGGQAGDFIAGAGTLILCENDVIKGPSGCPANRPVQFAEHSVPNNTGVWTVEWTPPSSNVGNIRFYVAGNAANGNGVEDAGDHVYTANATLTAAVELPNPTIRSEAGVISAGAFGAFTEITEGGWIEIFGTNLAATTREWAGGDFNGNSAPTQVDGVQVMVNNQPAYVSYISPTQVNAQVPAEAAVGPVQVRVVRFGNSTNPYTITKAALKPGVLAPASFNVGGRQYAVALFPESTSGGPFVGRENLIQGVPFRPAKPGDSITLYGVGFGPTTPAFPPGQIVTQLNQLTNPITIRFGETNATLSYRGLALNLVGLYQFNLEVPNVADGDHQINVTVGGVTVPQTMFLTVRR